VELTGLSGTTPIIEFEMFNSDPGGTPGTGVVRISSVRYWYGRTPSGSVSGGTIQLTYGEDDGVGDAADLRLVRSSNSAGTYNSLGGTGSSAPSGNIRAHFSSLGSSLGYFTLGSFQGDNSLPVELASFEATGNYGSVSLNWVTSSEVENLGFNIYRSVAEEENWSKVNSAMIDGKGTTSEESSYRFVDEKVAAGETYSYQLESVSINGVAEIEKTVDVFVPLPEEYVLMGNYPNPFNPTTNLRFRLPETKEVTINIYDMGGKLVKNLVRNKTYNAGEFTVQWDATDELNARVSSGMYVYHFRAGQFSKVGKMVLLK
jgi:hypothetical protein